MAKSTTKINIKFTYDSLICYSAKFHINNSNMKLKVFILKILVLEIISISSTVFKNQENFKMF